MNARRDENHKTIAFGVGDSGELLPLLFDPITDELLIIVYPTIAGSTVSRPTYLRDEDMTVVSGGIGDNGEVLPFLIDSNGAMLVDIL